MHVNELVADELEVLIARWKSQGIEFIDLDTAMADPVYEMENQYAGPGALSWLWRIRPPDAYGDYWFGEEQGRIQRLLGGLDSADKGIAESPR